MKLRRRIKPRHRRDWHRLWRYCRCGFRWRCPDSVEPVPMPYPPPPVPLLPPAPPTDTRMPNSRFPFRSTGSLRRPHARFRPHTATRPLFLCRECGAPWPCQPARLSLLVAYRDDLPGLRTHLASKLLAAIGDQPRLDPLGLAVRFLGWLPTRADPAEPHGQQPHG
ncbi:hypothetical protein [Plantactinospora alkalitolerans]|uniref:hypothetical protein n=1 Tax=Plantactinospora alkalitolerans TaxID=2789879 RepID=UPI001E3F2F30|nr:hypothetical protein [Plantactinospora alkalitolerans]